MPALFYLLTIDVLFYIGAFVYAFNKKKLIGIQLGMNISQIMGGTAALLSGIVLISEFPFHFTVVTFISAVIGILAGTLFGLLFDYQTALTGVTNGFMMGLMSPMLGSIINTSSLVIWFVHVVFFSCLLFIMISIQRS
ncbi:hypothetical protein [Domibacillus indicus]|uniref:hypothetical protein n=1 Tax=Domibacillus indicus TaxID=1437523 RepID=UPI000617DE2D|nr:hypothetical protein [Domibacillus indicus]